MIVNVASWLNLGRNKNHVHSVSMGIGGISGPDPNRIEIKEFETYFNYNEKTIPIQVHLEQKYINNVLKNTIVNARDNRLPIENTFLYTEVSYQKPPLPFKLIYTDKSIYHQNPWMTVINISDFIMQIEKNNEYLNRIEFIKNNL